MALVTLDETTDPGDRREGDGAPRRRRRAGDARSRRSSARSSDAAAAKAPPTASRCRRRCSASRRRASRAARCGVFPDVDSAAKAARKAFEQYERTPLETRDKMVAAMRAVDAASTCASWREYAVDETGLGRVEDKIKKNTLVADEDAGPEILRPIAYSGDHGLMLTERAPYGVIGAITPTTNPTETIINNGIGMVAGGNAVVFNVHPSARRGVRLVRAPAQRGDRRRGRAGEPDRARSAEPTIESAQALMKHPLRAHPRRHRRAGRGQGGDELGQARDRRRPGQSAGGRRRDRAPRRGGRRGIVDGASLDNNIICIAEKEVLAVASIADRLKELLVAEGCYLMNDRQVRQLEGVVLEGDHTNKKCVGKNAGVILKQIGVHVGDDVPPGHLRGRRGASVRAARAAHAGASASCAIPTSPRRSPAPSASSTASATPRSCTRTNIDALSAMARTINTSIFVKNGPNLDGLGYRGEGYTSFTIASPTGEGLTTAVSFTRERRCTLKDHFRFV